MMYFWILYDFLNIAVSQGNAATSVRYGGLCDIYFVENFVPSLSVKESWKSINFREVIDMSRVSCFFDSHCISNLLPAISPQSAINATDNIGGLCERAI